MKNILIKLVNILQFIKYYNDVNKFIMVLCNKWCYVTNGMIYQIKLRCHG